MARKTAAPSCHSTSSMRIAAEGTPVLALVGAPNSGKSTLFNALTGAKVQTGNWPGTSVEVSRGLWSAQPEAFDIIDLPGAYSLDPMSPDEEFTRDMLVECPPCERPDVVVVLVDATAPARGLNLAFQIAEYPYRVVIGVTKEDVAKQQGISIDTSALSRAVGMPVVSVNGRRRENLDALEGAVAKAMQTEPQTIRPNAELDQRFADLDAAEKVAVSRTDVGEPLSQRVDRVVLHPVLGPILFLAVMWAVFFITTTVAGPLQDGLEALITGPVSDAVRSLLPDHWLVSGLLVDGLIGGVGMVLTFAPLLALMFLCAQEGEEWLGGGVDKQQCAAIAQALKGEGFFAALEVPGEGAISEPAAAVLMEDIDYSATKIPWTQAEGDLRTELHHLMGGAHAEKAAALY